MMYFGTRLSDNLSRREPEGYLICLNVPVARTGIQEYLPEELGLPPGGGPIPVERPEEEVFSPACMASFEGMPVTDDHPPFPDGVTAENIRFLQKGHAHNLRRGGGKDRDLLLADLIITDPDLAEKILGGKREISCGYNYTLCEEGGRRVQREIRGNHVAVVDAGRAGPRVSIRDRKPAPGGGARNEGRTCTIDGKKERSQTNMMEQRKISSRERSQRSRPFAMRLARVMANMARDGQTVELAGLISDLVDQGGSDPAEMPVPAAVPVPAAAPVTGPNVAAAVPAGTVMTAAAMPAAVPVSAPAALLPTTAVPAVPFGPEAPASAGWTPVGEAAQAVAEAIGEAAEIPEEAEQSVTGSDCGPEIVALLREILARLSGPAAADGEDNPEDSEAPADADGMTAEAVAEAVMQAVEQAEGAGGTDPTETMVAGAVEEALRESAEGLPEETLDPDPLSADEEAEEPVSAIISPEETEDPDNRTADALRAAMAAFRPILRRMEPAARRQTVAKIAAGLRARDRRRTADRRRTGRPGAYDLIRGGGRGTPDAADAALGERIMARRNANYRRG